MVSVEEAKNILLNNIETAEAAIIPIENAVGLLLSEDVFSPVDLPPFNQSAMDGYAVKTPPGPSSKGVLSDKGEEKEMYFKIIGEIKAGEVPNVKLKTGDAVRIFTGAMVPDSAECVVMQENIFAQNGNIYLAKSQLEKMSNIRLEGSQIKKRELAISKNSYLNPASIGFLASMGIKKIKVFPKPKIAIVVTGNELQTSREKLKKGNIFESNSVTLLSALREIHLDAVKIFFARDEKMLLKEKINKALKNSDIVLISGGVSAGKYDLVSACLKELNVKELFYKVSQKPGMPLYAGKYLAQTLSSKGVLSDKREGVKEKIIFGLPGNPSAALVCFYEYVFPALRKFMGYSETHLKRCYLSCSDEYSKNLDRAHFLKCKITEGKATILHGQESFILKSFCSADGLIYLHKKIKSISKGENVEVHLLPTYYQL